jgi:hypothetical protein
MKQNQQIITSENNTSRLKWVWWYLIWQILDKRLAKQGFMDISQISQFVELACILRKTGIKFLLHAYTPIHISETGRPKSKRKIYLFSGFILK